MVCRAPSGLESDGNDKVVVEALAGISSIRICEEFHSEAVYTLQEMDCFALLANSGVLKSSSRALKEGVGIHGAIWIAEPLRGSKATDFLFLSCQRRLASRAESVVKDASLRWHDDPNFFA